MCSGVRRGGEANNAIRELASVSQTRTLTAMFVFIYHCSSHAVDSKGRKAARRMENEEKREGRREETELKGSPHGSERAEEWRRRGQIEGQSANGGGRDAAAFPTSLLAEASVTLSGLLGPHGNREKKKKKPQHVCSETLSLAPCSRARKPGAPTRGEEEKKSANNANKQRMKEEKQTFSSLTHRPVLLLFF